MIASGTRVAIVDDVPGQAQTAKGIAEEADLDPAVIQEVDGGFSTPELLLSRVREADCSAVICDHRLSRTGFASFTGAEFAALLYVQKIPALLLSTFSSTDSDSSIKLHRAQIPSLVARDELDPQRILDGLRESEEELLGHISHQRRLYRTLVRVEDVSIGHGEEMVDAIIHTWKPDRGVRFPLELIEDAALKEDLRNWTGESGRFPRMFAQVNVGCEHESDLVLRAFERAPEPDDRDF